VLDLIELPDTLFRPFVYGFVNLVPGALEVLFEVSIVLSESVGYLKSELLRWGSGECGTRQYGGE